MTHPRCLASSKSQKMLLTPKPVQAYAGMHHNLGTLRTRSTGAQVMPPVIWSLATSCPVLSGQSSCCFRNGHHLASWHSQH
eukprot:scaffold232753_cov17-Tisochrysis_lutea.AAC.1